MEDDKDAQEIPSSREAGAAVVVAEIEIDELDGVVCAEGEDDVVVEERLPGVGVLDALRAEAVGGPLHVGEQVVLGVIGVDTSGNKHVLGLCDGPSESDRVCRGLLRSLIERGLVVERARLFVIDGSAGLRKAILHTFGRWALIQRCQLHKMRNVLEHLPERKREWARAKMRKAWESASADTARSILEGLARSLGDHPSAAASVREGLEDTLTLLKLGVTGALYRTLRTTNPIENLQGTIRQVTRNVRRWRDGAMAVRWVAAALIEAESRFRRIKGVNDMPRFLKALDHATGTESQDVQKIA